jgi:hypothetical protein
MCRITNEDSVRPADCNPGNRKKPISKERERVGTIMNRVGLYIN